MAEVPRVQGSDRQGIMSVSLPAPPFDFDGITYEPKLDQKRLSGQVLRVFDVMRDGKWRTLAEIERITGDPQASVSARLRDLRKVRFGEFIVERRRRGKSKRGLWEYQVLPPFL